jgi:hypothetical protein
VRDRRQAGDAKLDMMAMLKQPLMKVKGASTGTRE